MNAESIDMRRALDVEDVYEWATSRAKPGDFLIHDSVVSKANPVLKPQDGEPTVTIRFFCALLPGGHYVALPLRSVPATDIPINGGHSWEWDGRKASLRTSRNPRTSDRSAAA
jgi:hypothetical protein